ncbi:MAG: metallophosphoesterase family protein [Lachnospiraceae bacterium]|nr:metallophosphoesterase family protein [Lachnospiraceae bacterium]
MRYYIADCHFYHDNLNHRMDMRGFADAEQMNANMIEQWNKKIRKNDEVVILGDFSFGKGEETNRILEQLNGKLFLIRGNHDDRYLKDRAFRKERFEWIRDYEKMHDNGRSVVLSHYPVFCYDGQYRRDAQGRPKTYMLYGHVHDTYDEILVNRFVQETRSAMRLAHGQAEEKNIPCQMINCFCMYSDYMPLSLDEWIELDAARREKLDQSNAFRSSTEKV